jgi:hypothetical protein
MLSTPTTKASILSAYKKRSLIRLCNQNGIKNASRLTKDELISALENSSQALPIAKEQDLLNAFKPFALLIQEIQKKEKEVDKYSERVRDSILEILGNSLSRLPCLVASDNPAPKDILAIRAYVASLERMHSFLKTERICQPGQLYRYDPTTHDGPESLSEGEQCRPISTGILSDGMVLQKAIVVR